jgi:hypothetical protein
MTGASQPFVKHAKLSERTKHPPVSVPETIFCSNTNAQIGFKKKKVSIFFCDGFEKRSNSVLSSAEKPDFFF